MSKLVCEACGSHDLTTTETASSPTSRREVYECECGATGTLFHDTTAGLELSGRLRLLPTPTASPVRRIRE